MKKIILITMAIAFLAGCSGPTAQQSQKESTKQPVKAAKQYDPWPKHQKSTAKPMTWDDLNKSPDEIKKDAVKIRKETMKKIKQFSEGKVTE
jgi:PBP1b-binding outer membrane lipoprotein LpoB